MSEFLIVAFATAGKMDLGVPVTCQSQSTKVYRAAPAGGWRKDVREVNGVCAGIHQGSMRIRRPR
jgi:hypothetical protein